MTNIYTCNCFLSTDCVYVIYAIIVYWNDWDLSAITNNCKSNYADKSVNYKSQVPPSLIYKMYVNVIYLSIGPKKRKVMSFATLMPNSSYCRLGTVHMFILTWQFSLLAWHVSLLSRALFQELPPSCLEPSGFVPSWPFPQRGPEFTDKWKV